MTELERQGAVAKHKKVRAKPIYAVVTTNIKTGQSVLLGCPGSGVRVFATPESARQEAIDQFGEGNSHVVIRVARIGNVLPGVI